jgi:hypothetical protein
LTTKNVAADPARCGSAAAYTGQVKINIAADMLITPDKRQTANRANSMDIYE